jgi:hypothetical protein
MKKAIGLGMLICNIPVSLADRNCRLGFSYEFCNNPYGEMDWPVIMKIYPKLPAGIDC